MSQENPLSERIAIAVPPELKRALEERAAELNLDFPTFIRAALALVARTGIDLATAAEMVTQDESQ